VREAREDARGCLPEAFQDAGVIEQIDAVIVKRT
jgi:hypothetical protein